MSSRHKPAGVFVGDGMDRRDLYRVLRLSGICAFFTIIFAANYVAAWRTLMFFALAAIFSMAVAYELTSRELHPKWLLICVCLIFGVTSLACYLLDKFSPVGMDARGALIAANDPSPPTRCNASGVKGLVMVFGKDRVAGQGNGPFTPIRIGSCPALTFTRTPKGLFVDAFGFDSDDNVIYRIDRNQFHQIVRGFLEEHRPDAGTLRVADNENQETLSIRYLNSGTVKIRGVFRCGDTQPVVITDDDVTIGGRPVSGYRCASIASAAAPVIEYASSQ